MRRSQRTALATASGDSGELALSPSTSGFPSDLPRADLAAILSSLQTMRNGDFSVRLPGSWTGLAGKIADTFNDSAAANQQMMLELKRVGQVVGKEGRTRERTKFHESRGAAAQALEIADSRHIDLVLSDHLMPGSKGTELARQIKAFLPKVPFILLSGVNEVPADANCADMFLSKLEGPRVLCEIVEHFLISSSKRQQDYCT